MKRGLRRTRRCTRRDLGMGGGLGWDSMLVTSATKARPSHTGSVASIMTGFHGVATASIRSWASARGSAGSRTKAHGPSLANMRRVVSRRKTAYRGILIRWG